MTTDSPAVALQDIRFSYQKNAAPVLAIDKWQMQRAESVFLYGASGSGKTTLLNLLGGVTSPDAGNIELLGQPFSSLSSSKRDKFRAQHIGVVFQQFNLISYLTVAENIAVAAYFGKGSDELAQRSADLVRKLQLPESVLHQKASNLSVGQQQRVAIARALINKPEILIVDEPTSALDASARDAFMELLMQISAESDCSLLFVSHDMGLAKYFSRQEDMRELNKALEVGA